MARIHCIRAIAALVLAVAACSPPASERPFAVSRTSPDLGPASVPLLLNDAVTVYFTAEVLPVSVTPDAVVVVDERGERVPGSLAVGSNWVAFHPLPPLTADLVDGSFRPGGVYRLLLAGSPRPDAIRARDGRRLREAMAFELRIASLAECPTGLPAPLRPPAVDVPFAMHTADLAQPLPAAQPRLQLHFSQPLLPSSVTPAAFEVTLLDGGVVEEIVPRRVRAITWSLDAFPGSSVELDLGALPARVRGGDPRPLRPGTLVNVSLRRGSQSVRDYAGRPPLHASSLWSVVPGGEIVLAEWPAADDVIKADDGLSPTFETRTGGIRPRVRKEAGNGRLGVFRPRTDTTLRAGAPFDRGDGAIVVSDGSDFPFLAIDIPAGVTVRIDGSAGPVRLLSCGSARLAGHVAIAAAPQPLPARRAQQPVHELMAAMPVVVLAAGEIEIQGRVTSDAGPTGDGACLLLASAGGLDLRGMAGELPFHTLLAFEAGGSAIQGARGQSVVFVATFTYGLADGSDFLVQGMTPWRLLPSDRDAGIAEFVDASAELDIRWQAAPRDPVRPSAPDLTLGRVGRLQAVSDQGDIAASAGSFVRLALSARVRSGAPVPRVREVRIRER